MSKSKTERLSVTRPKQKKVSHKHQSFWTTQIESLHPGIILSALYISAVFIRHLINIITTNGPIVYIDEGLYINLARGLAFNGSLTYRAMPTSYVYLTYPFFLIPLVRFLPNSANLYRAVQLYNTLLITSAIFPTYLLARQMKLNKHNSYIGVLFILLLPDMALSSYLMTECLLYPLFMWLAYFGYRAIEQSVPSFSNLFPCAILTTLLYFTKPGYIVFGAVLLVLLFLRTIHDKSVRGALSSLLSICILFGLIIGIYTLYRNTLDQDATLLTHYDKQIPSFSLTNILVAIQATLLHLITFLISGLGVLILIPSFGAKSYSREKRLFLISSLLAIVVSIVGIAIMVSLYEWKETWFHDRQHLRYIMCYSPILFLLLLSPDLESLKYSDKIKHAFFIVSLLTVFPGGYSAFTDASAISDSPSLAVFFTKQIGWTICILFSAGILLFIRWLLTNLKKHHWTASIRRLTVYALFTCLLLNTCTAYSIRSALKIQGSIDIEPEAQALAEMVVDEHPLMITTNLYDNFRGYQSDVHWHRPVQYVVSNNMLLDAIDTQGRYRPFIPLTQSPNTYNTPTIDTDLLIFDLTVASYMEFAETVELSTTPNGLYTLARIQKDQPYLKTAISGMYGYTLQPDSTGSLIVYDNELLERGSLTLHVQMNSSAPTDTVTFIAGNQEHRIQITNQPQWYSISLSVTQCDFWDIRFSSQNPLYISEYYTAL